MRNRFAGSSGLLFEAGEDRRAIDLEPLGRVRHFGVVAAGEVPCALFHLGEPRTARAASAPRLRAARAVESPAAELDLERRADGVDRFVVLDLSVIEHLELAGAVRAHAVRKGEAFADLAALRAAPVQGRRRRSRCTAPRLRAADGTWAEASHDIHAAILASIRRQAVIGVGWASAVRRLRHRPAVIGHFVLPPADRRRSPAPPAARPHRQDHGRAAGDDVAAGEHARQAGRLRRLVGDDVAPLVQPEPRRGLARRSGWRWCRARRSRCRTRARRTRPAAPACDGPSRRARRASFSAPACRARCHRHRSRISTGECRKKNSMPSSLACRSSSIRAGASASERR